MSGVYIALAIENLKGRRKLCFLFFVEFLAKNLHNFIFVSVLAHGWHISNRPK